MYPLTTYHLHQIFNELDRNKDDLVSIDELVTLLTRLGLHAKRAELEILKIGTKLRRMTSNFHRPILGRRAARVFDLNDGFISGEELRIALGRLGLWDEKSCGLDCMQMIGVYDTNSDGLLDFEEFKEMMSMDSLESY
ncbi:hypothetical protein SASPL_148166 [Salvia splendens]|uniref:EF-hand domain-containing protein n=1 Tax=Salvia splendens TaxID=180675 RepID=A0A8X8Z346_SALSN|nr:hypothetical protein SASPL_148166 [Salvia splendens]